MRKCLLGILLLALLILPGLALGEGDEELTLTLELDKYTVAIDEGESITGTWVASGGVEPYKYSLWWTIDWHYASARDEISSDLLSDTFTPTYGKHGTLEVYAEDSLGNSVLEKVEFSITGDESGRLFLSGSADKESYSVGNPVTFKWKAEGGVPPYNYNLNIYEDNEEVNADFFSNSTPESLVIVPRFGDRGSLRVTVVDTEGNRAYTEIDFEITGSLPVEPLSAAIQFQSNFVKTGETAISAWSEEHPPMTLSLSGRYKNPTNSSPHTLQQERETVRNLKAKIPSLLYSAAAGSLSSMFVTVWEENCPRTGISRSREAVRLL